MCFLTLSEILSNRSPFSVTKKRKFACVVNQEDMNYEGTPVKAPPFLKEG